MTFCFLSPQVVCEALKRFFQLQSLLELKSSSLRCLMLLSLREFYLSYLIIQVTEDKLIATCLSTNDQISLQFAFSLVFRQPLFLSPRK